MYSRNLIHHIAVYRILLVVVGKTLPNIWPWFVTP